MKIGIDARFYGTLGKGLGRYTQKLIENLEKIDSQNQYYIFLRRENHSQYEPQNNNFRKVLADFPWYSFSEQINMPKLLNSYKLDLVHFPHFNVPWFYKGKFVVTIHDLILLHYPTLRSTTLNPFFYWFKFAVYKKVIKRAIQKSEKVITVSEFTKEDILKNYKLSSEKIAVTYEACDDVCLLSSKKEENILLKYKLINRSKLKKYGIIKSLKSYLLYVGNAYPHKNLERLILAFSKIKKKDLHLVLVGKEDHFYRELKKLVKDKKIKRVIFTDFVPDEELDIIYKNASIYVFPSLYEGFGLPPLEAMAKGVPVAVACKTSLPEILGEAAYYFDPGHQDKIQAAIEKVLADDNLRKNLIKKGYHQIQKYSWKKMAQRTLDIYANILI